nr:MAG TPA: hypothetical protein [Caudoviricetes sp.]
MKLQSKGVIHTNIQKTPDLCKSGVSVPNLSLKGTSVMHTSIGTTHAACQGVGDLTTSEATDNLGHRRPIPGIPPALHSPPPGRYQAVPVLVPHRLRGLSEGLRTD